MEQIYECCCALDVHKASVSACVRVPGRGGGRSELRGVFSTVTSELLALRDWLQGLGVTHVAMEATGVYWKPVWYLLEDEFELILCHAAHVKNVPGRKTDASDAQWLCQLLEHGLLRGSFVPPKPVRELRDLTRYRKTLIRERQREANRLHKVLEDAGIKLSCVASDVLGVSGRAMIEALIAGEGDPTCWPSSRAAGCARSCQPFDKRSTAASLDTTRGLPRTSSTTSTTSSRRSRRSATRSGS
jgi:hypothetical protein